MEFNYPNPCYKYGFANYQIVEMFDAFVKNIPPGTYLTSKLKESFDQTLHSHAQVPELSAKAFTQALNSKGLKAKKLARGRCHTKE